MIIIHAQVCVFTINVRRFKMNFHITVTGNGTFNSLSFAVRELLKYPNEKYLEINYDEFNMLRLKSNPIYYKKFSGNDSMNFLNG